MVVYNTDQAAPRDWSDLGRAELGLVKGFGHARIVEEAKQLAPELNPQAFELEDVEPLLERVAHATLPFAIADAQSIALLRNVYIDIDGAFVAGPPRDLAWLFAPGEEELVEQARAFFRMIRENGTLQRLIDRYYGHVLRVEPNDASLMHEKIRTLLPQFRNDFQYAQELSGIEWRLLAAVAYQESHWDPLATSPTNVRGIMMLTEDTAQRMNVVDRLDPRQSILAGAQYLVELKRMLPERILEPDRTWIALAAYNIGFAHLEDARILAQRRKLNPDAWTDLKKALPMLAFPEQAKSLRHGFARGGAPVIFVENVRAYYDLLNRMESPYLPKLHAPRKCSATQLRAC
jgi:membrane-bound lytic murein transglycosylase F